LAKPCADAGPERINNPKSTGKAPTTAGKGPRLRLRTLIYREMLLMTDHSLIASRFNEIAQQRELVHGRVTAEIVLHVIFAGADILASTGTSKLFSRPRQNRSGAC
jgi:hypothetical protein